MFSHVMLGVNDLEVSKKFYDALLGTLGYGPGVANKNRYFYRSPTGTFAITTPINGEPACHGNGSTIGANVFLMHSVPAGSLVVYEEKQLRILEKSKPATELEWSI